MGIEDFGLKPRQSGFTAATLPASLLKISINFKPLSSAQEGRNLESISGFLHYTAIISSEIRVFLHVCAQGPASAQRIRRIPTISAVGYRGESVKENPKSWT